MTFTPISRWHDMPSYFNTRAADAVFDTISKMDDDEAEVAADLLVGELFLQDTLVHADVVEKGLADYVERHGERVRKNLLRSYITKRQRGESVAGLTAAAEVISKAQGDDRYNRNEHGRFASVESRARRAHERSIGNEKKLRDGEFVRSHHQVAFDLRTKGKWNKPLSDAEAKRQGVTSTPSDLKGAQRLAYQQAYAQIAATVKPYAARDNGNHYIHLQHAGGESVHPLADVEADDFELPHGVRSFSISRIPDFDSDLDAFGTLQAMGGGVAGNYGEGGSAGVDDVRALNAGLRNQDHFDRAGTRVMRRMGAASEFLDNSIGTENMPRAMRAATRAGKVVGLYGPEAQNVVGPAADRAAYRYRGTERTPDRRLSNALESVRRSPNVKSAQDARDLAVHGIETDAGWRPSGVLSYFRSRLPSADLNTLQRKSGTIPPSEGVMFDASGKMVSQSVGYADDHYLPFNLKNLKPLRGGEYIRTRTWGGPTTEDMYTGLVAGAKAMSVVSHNGVYTVEFDPAFKGSRRYNDKAARMVARYGQLLDAVKNGEITTGQVDPARMDELAVEAESSFDPDTEPAEYRAELDRLRAREQRNPTFSAAQRSAAAQSYLDNEALKHRTSDGHEMTREELVDQFLNRRVLEDVNDARREGQSLDPGDAKRDIARTYGLNDPDPQRQSENMILAMGHSDRFQRYVEREEQTYRASLQPLELNGPGYEMALNALREQFPYYIQGVEFHPWSDAKNGRDTGYVKPKHTRPAAALSGYFDEDLGGKVRAHTTRGQGQHSQPQPYRNRAQRVADAAKQRAERTGDTVRAGAGRGSLSTSDQRELRYQADRQVADAIRGANRFSSGMRIRGEHADITDAARSQGPERLTATDWRAIAPAVKELRDASAAELNRMQPDELRRKVEAAMREVDNHGMFDLPEDVVRAHRNDGRAPKVQSFDRTDVSGNLRGLDTDRDFGQAVLQPGREMDPDKVLGAFAADAKVRNLADHGYGLPSPEADDFDDAVANVRGQLERGQRAVINWKEGRGQRPANHNQLPQFVEGLARATQYRRRYSEALEAKAEGEARPIGFTGAGGGTFTVTQTDGGIELGFQGQQARGGTITPLSQSHVNDEIHRMESQF